MLILEEKYFVMKPKTGKPKLTTASFTEDKRVQQCLAALKEKFGENYERLIVSDVLDDAGHQYVNLVQKGGGVLGIALVGYTYILEQCGIRFMRLAGTSAGAINTALITVIGDKQSAKSEQILEALSGLNFFDLVDGHPFAKWVIKNFITSKDKFIKKINRYTKRLVFLTFISLLLDFFLIGYNNGKHISDTVPEIIFIFTALYLLMFVSFFILMGNLFRKLKNTGYGINPGNFFLDWIKGHMQRNNVNTVTDFNNKAAAKIPGLQLRNNERVTQKSIESLKGDVTLIASELVTGNKIEFPKMSCLFSEDINQFHPADFVRASMSIPLFFESYIIEGIPVKNPAVKQAWYDVFRLEEKEIPTEVRFVDGGILSNFPINVFFTPDTITPRLPNFGIDLDDVDPNAPTDSVNIFNWGLPDYLGRIFNTVRYYYDKDFLLKNRVFQKGVGKIPLYGFNWLNFFLKDEDKINLFVKGCEAACDFLLHFDWKDYQSSREVLHDELKKKSY